MKLVVTIPAQNEAKTIADVVTGTLQPIEGIDEIEVLVINDASTDSTRPLAQEAGARVIDLTHRTGLGNVFRIGLQHAMRSGADIIVNIDGDGQFDPADIPKLIAPVLRDEADFVTCTRFADPAFRPKMPWIKYIGNRMVAGLINRLCGHGACFTDVSCGFRAFSRDAAYRLTLFGNFTYTQEVFLDLFRKNLRIVEVPLHVRGERPFGRSRVASNVLRYGLHSGMIMLRATRDIKPLKFFGSLSGVMFIISVLLGCWLVGWYLWTGRTSPYTSLITVDGVILLVAFVLLVIGLLADMIGRHRLITEELLYLARKRLYGRAQGQPSESQASQPMMRHSREPEHAPTPHLDVDTDAWSRDRSPQLRDKVS